MKPSMRGNRQAGLSLLEVLSGMAVFAVVAAGLASTTVSTIKLNSTSRHTTVASFLIHDKVEELRSLNPAANPPDFTPGNHYDAGNPLSPLGVEGGMFTRTWTVTPNRPGIGMAEVVVTVSWRSPDGPRSMSAATFVCRTETCT